LDGLKIRKLLEPNFKEGEKLMISPVGDVIGIDGRSYKIDGEVVIRSVQRNGIDIVLDENHSFSKACGWFSRDSLELRDDGIYAALETNELGKEFIEKKMYRYLSPVYDVDSNRVVTGIDSVGLVNRPNILKEELNSKTGDEGMTNEEIEALKKANTDKEKEIEDLKKQMEENSKKAREARIDGAIAAGTLDANAKSFAMDLDDEKLDTYLVLHKKESNSLKNRTEIEKNSKENISDTQKEINKQLGLHEEGDK
jgi:hypothetical protein